MDDDQNRQSEIKNRARSRTRKKTSAAGKGKASFVENFLNEWQLFWQGLAPGVPEDEFDKAEISPLDLPKIKALTKTLSDERKKLNRRLESIQKEIDLNTAKLESLKVVGADPQDTVARLSELTDIGQLVSEQLTKLDHRLEWARKQQTEMSSR